MKEKQLKKRKSSSSSSNTEQNSPSHSLLHANVHTILLASLANLHTTNFSARTLLTKCLNNLHNQSLYPSKTLTLINNNLFLSLLPSLLRATKSIPSIAKRTAEIIGVIALQSFECNEKIASDEEILKALLDALGSSNKKISMAACNAVLDLSTTFLAREKLCELNAVVKLMSTFLHNAALPTKHVLLCNGKISAKFSGRAIMDNAFLVLIIDAAVTLVNACNVKQLSNIPEKLSEITLSILKVLLVQVRDQSSERHIAKCIKERTDCLSVIKLDDLTESIFRLSIDSGHFTATCGAEQVKKGIFGPNQFDFEYFMFNFWEKTPFLLRKPLGSPNDHRDILSSVLWSPNSGRIHDVLSSILRSLVSCPPLPSDEVDILNFLKEAKDGLGQPITYGQDIRVIKAVEGNGTDQGYPKSEVHFQQQWDDSWGPDLINVGDVQKCGEAYQKGYTIALRGMEFRSDNIASVANGLAVLFGQPSVGANSYLTPPGSQGLARHYDDHCVFVCQLLGQKQWTVYPRSTLQLPRLYEPRDSSLGSEGEVPDTKSEQFLLGEGDILYIPRGCLHEACTRVDDGGSDEHDASTGFSLHLTLGIEVESPFEWEGFAHVALQCWNWNQNNKQLLGTVLSPFDRTIDFMSVHLLHVAIQQIGSVDPTFAKACMVVAFSSPSDAQAKYEDALGQSQRDTFKYVISRIDRDARFLEAFKSIEVAVREKKEDMFQRMRWIRHLYPEKSMKERLDWDNPLVEFENIFLLFDEHREFAETVFVQIKSRFCREVIFEDACKSFDILLQKYKRVRTQYMNGMLNLHSNGNI